MNLKKYKKPLLIGLAATLLSSALCGLSALLLHIVGTGLVDTNAASRFERGELRYTQISVFYSTDANMSSSQLDYTATDIENRLKTDSYAAPSDNARIMLSAYGAEKTASFSGNKGSCEARAFCTGGDFFYFHPLNMTSGWYYGGNELNDNTVILDEQLAWQLYGALDVSGMQLTVNGITCTVAGVTKGSYGKKEAREYADTPTAYIQYALAERIFGNVSAEYCDFLVPNPVTDYGKKLVGEALGLYDDSQSADNDWEKGEQHMLIENTARYSPLRVIRSLKDKNERIVRTDNIVYPYWENAARLCDSRAMYAGIALIAFSVIPVLYAFVWIVLIFNRKEIIIKKSAVAIGSIAKSTYSHVRSSSGARSARFEKMHKNKLFRRKRKRKRFADSIDECDKHDESDTTDVIDTADTADSTDKADKNDKNEIDIFGKTDDAVTHDENGAFVAFESSEMRKKPEITEQFAQDNIIYNDSKSQTLTDKNQNKNQNQNEKEKNV